MSVDSKKLFFKEFTLAAQYTAANIVEFLAQHTHLKLIQTGGDAEFSFSGVSPGGAKVEGKILDEEEINFNSLATERIAVKGTGTLRVWAWHQT